jgi:amidase
LRRQITRVAFVAAVATAFGASAAGPARLPVQRAPAASEASFDVVEKTITELQDAMAARTVSSRQLVAAYLARVAAYDQEGPRLNAMVTLNARALDAAKALDDERASGRVRGPLHGIPVVVKDNYDTRDLPTTGGSIALAGFSPERDAFQVRKLRDAGAVIIGKTNLHELARGITTISSISGQTRNPYDPARNPGGSSGGTGAAVAASFAAAGMGTDTCGSIRIPAANNNLFGLRGTMGLSSRQGIIPLSHTQDVGGPLARSVVDVALMLDATVGADADDPVTRDGEGHRAASYRDALAPEALAGARLGVVRNLFGSAPEDTEGGDVVRKAIDAMRDRGATIVDVAIAGLETALQGSSVINTEFKFDLLDYLARYPQAPVHSLGDILERGDYHAALEAGFKQSNAIDSRDSEAHRIALHKRAAVRELITAALEEHKVDALVYPVLSRKAALIGEPVRGMNNCQASASSGFPALSVPAGFTADGVPIGMELLGPPWTESRLLSIAYGFERAVRPRRAPATTPVLVNGKRPPPLRSTAAIEDVRATFTFDPVTGRLSYDVSATPPRAGAVAVAVHRAPKDRSGPVIFSVLNGSASTGDVVLQAIDREALARGDLYLGVRSMKGESRVQLQFRPE